MVADLDAFLLYDASYYFKTAHDTIKHRVPWLLYLGTTGLGGWGAPPRRQILQGAATACNGSPCVDVLPLGSIPRNYCPNCAPDDQQRMDFVGQYGGDVPWTNWRTLVANPDSYESPYPGRDFTTQAQRGGFYQNTVIPASFNGCESAAGAHPNTCHFVGSGWWGIYDSRPEKLNFGLATPRDDPYDGVAATPNPGYDAWGYPTGCLSGFGCEAASYGDVISYVRKGNLWVLDQLAGTPVTKGSITLGAVPH